MRGRSRVATALLALVALLVPASALGHPRLESTTPRSGSVVDVAPPAVALSFVTSVEEAFLRVEVTGPGGAVVAGPPRLTPGDDALVTVPLTRAPAGLYRVRWHAMSQDGHAGSGAFGFGVGDVAAAPVAATEDLGDDGPLAVIARLLVMLGPILVLGLVATRAWVVEASLGGRGATPAWGDAVAGASRGWWIAVLVGMDAWLTGLVLGPIALLDALGAGGGDLGTLLRDTRWGTAWWIQAAALVATVALVLALRLRRAPLGQGWAVALAAPAAAALLSLSWAGHASGGNDRAINIGADGLHALATGAWIGGLLALVVLLVPALRALEGDDRVRLAAASIVRFSALAVACVAILVVTGVYRALAEVPSIDDLSGTSYGRTLLVKLGIFGVMLVGAAYNRFVLHPRLERAALGLDPTDRGASGRIRSSVIAELVLAGGVLIAVAVLVSLPPP